MLTFALKAYVSSKTEAQEDWDERVTKIIWQVIPEVGEKINLGLVDHPLDHEVKDVLHNLPLGDNTPFSVVSVEVTEEQMKELQNDPDWSYGYSCMMGEYDRMLDNLEN